MAVFTQLERLDWNGKKVIAVMTHEGSGLGSCERDLKKICTGAIFEKVLPFTVQTLQNQKSLLRTMQNK